EELLSLRAFLPPRGHEEADLVEALEGAVHVHRIQLVHRHAVGEERLLVGPRAIDAGPERARSGKLLGVPEFGPRGRTLAGGKLLGVEGPDVTEGRPTEPRRARGEILG